MKSGRVFLVGAGPGDPGLITVRGRECIGQADVILCDDLVDRRVLRYARPDAKIVACGKHGDASERDRQQAGINERMVAEARAGRIVVRLKGGDPFVFGRGGEEAAELALAGIPFEIVPGVSSAIAAPAYAGIPVTHRGLNSSFAIVTGHEAPGTDGRVDWDALAQLDTLVFLMAMKRLPEVVARLVSAGKRQDTPAACIAAGTRPDQAVVTTTLGELDRRVREAGLRPPAVIVVGEVVRLRDQLRWFETRPLFGRVILLTRAPEQARSLAEPLDRLGAHTIEAPAIRLEALDDTAPLDRAIADLEGFDWVVFTSANGVALFLRRLFQVGRDLRALGRCRIAAIGPATAAELADRGIRADLVPGEFRGEELADELASRVSGARVLLPRAAGARDVLPRRLQAAGADVVDLATYRAVRPDRLPDAAREAIASGRVDAVTFTSSSTVKGLTELLRAEGLSLGGAAVACIGPVTAATARECGFRVDVEATEYTSEGLVRAILDLFSAEGTGVRSGC